MNYTVWDDLAQESLEAITLEISKPKSKPFLINSWYRPPDSALELLNIYEDLITRMDSENKEVVLICDFNCDWTRLINNRSNAQTNKLAEIAKTFQFEQLINEPTRITATTKTLIDLAFTNKPELINGSGAVNSINTGTITPDKNPTFGSSQDGGSNYKCRKQS